jgi:hypothetical protein
VAQNAAHRALAKRADERTMPAMIVRHAWATVLSLAAAATGAACATAADDGITSPAGTTHATTSATTTATGGACTPCVTAKDCAGAVCAQFGGDIYCAADCAGGKACPAGTACTTVSGVDGNQVDVCAPTSGPCAVGTGAGGASGGGGAATTTQPPTETCGALVGPDVKSCCTSCQQGDGKCQPNGCYGGWWCDATACKCHPAPDPASCGGGAGGSGQTTSTSTTTGGAGGNGGSIKGIDDGKLDTLSFAVVGDTRPPMDDDTAAYPKAIIEKIYAEVAAENPRPAFVVGTGDYMFAKAWGSQSGPQLDLYLAARAQFPGPLFPALGNHECTGAVASNCGQGNADGVTKNYTTFLSKMLAPLGVTQPWYTVHVASTNGSWTAKFVYVAPNAWSSAQGSWLDAELAKPTTYTFVVRHEGNIATQAPGVTPSAAIIAKHPLTMLIVGHTHTYAYYANEKQLVVGNGGAPLTSAVQYGYVAARQRADGAIVFRSIRYDTGAVVQQFAVKPDGSTTK